MANGINQLSHIVDGYLSPYELVDQLRQIGTPSLLLAPMGRDADEAIFGHFIGRRLASGLILNLADLTLSQELIMEIHPPTGISLSIHLSGHQTVRYEGQSFGINSGVTQGQNQSPTALLFAHAQEHPMQRCAPAGDRLRLVTLTLTDQWISNNLPANHPLRDQKFQSGARALSAATDQQIKWAEELLSIAPDTLRALRQEGLASILCIDLIEQFTA